LQLSELKQQYQNFYGASNAEISIVGDFDGASVKKQLASMLGDWKSPVAYTRAPSLANEAQASSVKLETPDKANAFYLADLPFEMNDQAAEYPALLVADTIFGGGIKSRLFARVRQKEGISYGVGSGLAVPATDNNASLTLYAMFAPQNLEKLQNAIKEELALLLKDGITETELSDAKQALAQNHVLRRAQDPSLASSLRSHLFLGRNMAFDAAFEQKIAALSVAEVNAALRKYIKPDALAHYYAGDFAGVAKKK